MSAPKKKRQDIAAEVNHAREHIVEYALLAFIEDVDGKAPSDDEIVAHQIWANFSRTPLTTFEKDGVTFDRYFVWKRKHVLALGFYDAGHPLDLKVVRVPREQWPVALELYIYQFPPNQGDPAAKP